MSSLNDIKTTLLTVTSKTYHYTPPENVAGSYIIWAEDSQGESVWADGRMDEQAIQGTIDYFTKTEHDANVKKIQDALNDAEISFRLNSVQHERDTGYIHFEWVFEVGQWQG